MQGEQALRSWLEDTLGRDLQDKAICELALECLKTERANLLTSQENYNVLLRAHEKLKQELFA